MAYLINHIVNCSPRSLTFQFSTGESVNLPPDWNTSIDPKEEIPFYQSPEGGAIPVLIGCPWITVEGMSNAYKAVVFYKEDARIYFTDNQLVGFADAEPVEMNKYVSLDEVRSRDYNVTLAVELRNDLPWVVGAVIEEVGGGSPFD